MLASLLPILALGAPYEASGIVTNVVDGDTFDLRIDKTDPRIIYEIERVRLADVDSPEMRTPIPPRSCWVKGSGWTSTTDPRMEGTPTRGSLLWSTWRT